MGFPPSGRDPSRNKPGFDVVSSALLVARSAALEAAERRRDFLTLLGGTAAWPLAARAQQTKVHRIGALLLGNADAESFQMELREGLRKSSYIEGQNLLFDLRSAEGKLDLLPKLAAELVALRVDVIVALYSADGRRRHFHASRHRIRQWRRRPGDHGLIDAWLDTIADAASALDMTVQS